MPDSVTVEVEFTAGVWTDVTAYLDGPAGGSIRFGRTSPFGTVSPGSLTLTLANDDGRFTPGRQTLADGVTVHPYWPNVVPRKRIRVAYVISGTPFYRFIGYVKGWPPSMIGGTTPRVQIDATTVDDRLSRVNLPVPLLTEIAADSPALYWPLTDGAAPATEIGSGSVLREFGGSSARVTFGSDGPGDGNDTGISFAPNGADSGRVLGSTNLIGTPNGVYTLELWINPGAAIPGFDGAFETVIGWTFANTVVTAMQLSSGGILTAYIGSGVSSAASLLDSAWHQIVAIDGGGTASLYVDGVLQGTSPTAVVSSITQLFLGELSWPTGGLFAPARYSGGMAHVALYAGALSPARIAAHYSAGFDWAGEVADARIKRFLGYGGLAASDWTVDTSTVVCGGYSQGGKDVATACQDTAVTEGGGSAFYVGTDGKVQFRNRAARKPGAPSLTLDAEADLDGSVFAPAFDDTQIVNQEQAARGTGGAAGSMQIIDDVASQTAYGLLADSFTSYAQDDADVLANAQDRLAKQRQPGYRLGQLTVDLATAQTAGLYAAVAATVIGSRVRVTNLPPRAAPLTQLDVYVEGWTDTFSTNGYSVMFDTSPADNPPGMVWGDATYGRWQCDSNTLNAAITAAATTLVIATAAGKPTFTTAPGAYPLTIQVGTEHIRLNSAPGGAVSPQTFTGVTRGVDGTTAAAQAGAAGVHLAPASTWML